jgi:hypothetical protein
VQWSAKFRHQYEYLDRRDDHDRGGLDVDGNPSRRHFDAD